MAGDTILTVVGNLTADPELRYTPSGVAVANFTIASTPRTFDRKRNEWVDGEALFLRCSIWRDVAEHVAESLSKGMRVFAQGKLRQRSYETREGERRTTVELDVEEIGPSLRYANARVERITNQRAPEGYREPARQEPTQPRQQPQTVAAALTPQPDGPGSGWPDDDNPPF